MRFAALLALLIGASAWTRAAVAAPSPDAGVVLSRYPAGQLPDNATVQAAIHQLGVDGHSHDLALLDHIAATEAEALAARAELAARGLRARLRQETRTAFKTGRTDPAQALAWLSTHREQLVRADGTRLGPTEAAAAAYAAVVLAGADGDALPVGHWAEAGRALEDAGNPPGALVVYAQAAAGGDVRALEQITSFGVNPERLLLGLSTGLPLNLPTALGAGTPDILMSRGSAPTTAVLLEQAAGAGADERARAIESLADMLRQGTVPEASEGGVRSRLEAARTDPRPAVQETAREALVTLELAEVLQP